MCGEMEKGALWMGSCLQSLEEPRVHSAWEPGRKSHGMSQLPMVLLRPTENPPPHTRPPLSAQTSTEDADARPSDSHRSTLAQSRAPQGSFFPTASPSSGVTVSGPQVTTFDTCCDTCCDHMSPKCCDHISQHAHQHAPAQRENLPSSPTSLHMEMRAAGVAQEGLQWWQGLVWPALL